MRAYRNLMQGPTLRIAGATLTAAALPLGHHLRILTQGRGGHEPVAAYALALITFLCATAGAALLVHGRHIFDRIPVSQPWTRQDRQMEDTQRAQGKN